MKKTAGLQIFSSTIFLLRLKTLLILDSFCWTEVIGYLAVFRTLKGLPHEIDSYFEDLYFTLGTFCLQRCPEECQYFFRPCGKMVYSTKCQTESRFDPSIFLILKNYLKHVHFGKFSKVQISFINLHPRGTVRLGFICTYSENINNNFTFSSLKKYCFCVTFVTFYLLTSKLFIPFFTTDM